MRFGSDRYQFVVSPASALRPVYDMIMDTDLLAGGTSIFEGYFTDRHQEALDALFTHLLGEEVSTWKKVSANTPTTVPTWITISRS